MIDDAEQTLPHARPSLLTASVIQIWRADEKSPISSLVASRFDGNFLRKNVVVPIDVYIQKSIGSL